MFRDYARGIHSKAVPSDPNFLRIAVACGKIEQWCEHHYPSFVTINNGTAGFNSDDARSRIVLADQKRDADIEKETRLTAIRNGLAGGSIGDVGDATGKAPPLVNNDGIPWEILGYLVGAFVLVLGWSVGIIYLILWYFDDV